MANGNTRACDPNEMSCLLLAADDIVRKYSQFNRADMANIGLLILALQDAPVSDKDVIKTLRSMKAMIKNLSVELHKENN